MIFVCNIPFAAKIILCFQIQAENKDTEISVLDQPADNGIIDSAGR
jgi:hypothetical protein